MIQLFLLKLSSQQHVGRIAEAPLALLVRQFGRDVVWNGTDSIHHLPPYRGGAASDPPTPYLVLHAPESTPVTQETR